MGGFRAREAAVWAGNGVSFLYSKAASGGDLWWFFDQCDEQCSTMGLDRSSLTHQWSSDGSASTWR
jgi:hypothetical protein